MDQTVTVGRSEIDQQLIKRMVGYHGLLKVVRMLADVAHDQASALPDADYKAVCMRDSEILTNAGTLISQNLSK